jgi:transcription initiation factor IIE alpha subunit
MCPGCGKDLNSDSCTCTITKTDPRFKELKKLLQ